ncbi:D-amino-acid oxidase [Pseudomonas putida]|uniref:D-amino-acid oxidase n=1 Tax=Pseudomonas putida TaxID=303 RepID=A0AA37RAZ8_PSEPU|nr:FAD-binding oxidoreductase [Pseudomonas putida]GLO13806.1 D-amino-acid oxidase [Pseudomonas putida]GLO33583.1 D-amino-acid oxidase [Pseudomonas putida]HDS0966138.1 FAD-binding oxidoreductase [Pseudomonas putida]HDS0992426.1 FAD-binding oxidoreductase [Pseudomonas putida]
MAGKAPHVIVIGAGILGASIAWHLSGRARVTVLEVKSAPAKGVTGHSYGWVGTGSRIPSEQPASFALEQHALLEFPLLEALLGPLPVAAQGALIWLDDQQQTCSMLAEQQAAGVNMVAVGREAVHQLQPGLVDVPEMALWAPDDFAVEPDVLTCRLLSAAQDKGAVVRGDTRVLAVEMRGERVIGVRTTQGVVGADIVVLANAMGAQALASPLGINLPIYEEAAVLLRFEAAGVALRHLLCADALELRPGLGGGLVSAADLPLDGEAGLAELGRDSVRAISDLFGLQGDIVLQSIKAVARPKTRDGTPLRTFLPKVEGLYAAVAHPGVILAPLLGRLVSEDILGL